MADNSSSKARPPIYPTDREGFFERFLRPSSHKTKTEDKEYGHESEAKNPTQPQKQESEMEKLKDDLKEHEKKFKDYIHKDEELNEDGHIYAGLM
ncbi:uncharacterized protein N7483_008986 [Penicillium malachiteum]|uniref:uncharacterized protein n=1 Tax=Penicillium malachiteum TaxID=1324776 RepID=UPI0025494DD1|nr:uncharacterized protein N7483_008986 [Penicillium malachiteum]KAJ5721052.1 hypothetical protein N7483_008986 [Penicillium malachiteum]